MTGVDLKWWMVKMQLRSSLTWKDSSTSCPRQTVREDPGPECSSQQKRCLLMHNEWWGLLQSEACLGKDLFYPDAKSKTTGFLSEECQLVCKLQSSEHASCRYPCFNRGFPFLRVTKRFFFFMFFHVLIHGISLSFLWQPGFAGGLVFKTWNICAHNRSRQCSRPCHQICSKISAFCPCFSSFAWKFQVLAHLPWYWWVHHFQAQPHLGDLHEQRRRRLFFVKRFGIY